MTNNSFQLYRLEHRQNVSISAVVRVTQVFTSCTIIFFAYTTYMYTFMCYVIFKEKR